MAYRALAVAAAARRPERVDHYIGRALAVARMRESAHETAVTQLCAARLALHAGDSERALALLDEAEAAFTALDMAWHRAEAARLRELMPSACSA